MTTYFNSNPNKLLQEPMEIDFSSTDENDMIMEVEKTERNNAHTDFSSANDEMVQALERVGKRTFSVICAPILILGKLI